MARDPAAAGPEHMMTSIRTFTGPLMIVCALLGAGHALAADEFPFDRELLLDAAPMRLNAKDTPVPFHPNLWGTHRPTARTIARAVRELLRR